MIGVSGSFAVAEPSLFLTKIDLRISMAELYQGIVIPVATVGC